MHSNESYNNDVNDDDNDESENSNNDKIVMTQEIDLKVMPIKIKNQNLTQSSST